MLKFSGERIVPEADNCEPKFALKMYQEHITRYLFASQVCAGKRVLDVGCGVGYGAHLLARRGAVQVVAIDLKEEAIRHAREFYRHRNVQHVVASAEDFAFREPFDVVVCFELIEHVSRQHCTLERIAAALGDDGMLIMSTPRFTGAKRSAFHTRELSFSDFSNLLDTYFPQVYFFFENNHFASLIAADQPTTLQAVHSMHPQFSLGQADYLIAVASRSPIDVQQFQPQLVINNDDYVRNLERDVEILHRAEDDFKAQIAVFSEHSTALKAQIDTEAKQHEAALDGLKAKLSDAAGNCKEQITALKAQLSEEIEKRRTETSNLKKYNQEHNSRQEVENVTLQKQLQHMRTEMAAVRSERDGLLLKLEAAGKQLSEMDAWRNSTQQQGALWRQSASDLQATVDSLRKRIDDLYQSGSWRITAPLRKIVDIALRARHGRPPRQIVDRTVSAKALVPIPVFSSVPEARTIVSEGATTASRQLPTGVFQGKSRFDVLYVIGCHEGESKRYRAHNLVTGLEELGYQCAAILDNDLGQLIQSDVPIQVVVLFRSGDTPAIHQLITWCRERGVPICYDIDDLVFEPESVDLVRVVASFSAPERMEYIGGVEQYRKVLLSADFATCPTTFLASRIELLGKRAAVIPNSLNYFQTEAAVRLLDRPQNETGTVRIGYFSGSNTHQVDFQSCEGALLSILENNAECRFVLGGILDLGPQWDPYANRIDRLPFMPYQQMLETLATIDINLAPLEVGNPYCEGKSQLKIFEAGLVSVPTVASATASYREAIEHGIDGLLASTEATWREALENLIHDPQQRREMGRRARQRALAQFGLRTAAQAAVTAYGLKQPTGLGTAPESAPELADLGSPAPGRLKISWIIPGLIIGGGGHRNILRAAYHLKRFGHNIELYFTNPEMTEEQLADAVHTHFYPLDCPMYRYQGSIRPTDVLFATHWSTVDAAVRARSVARELMYFVQDFEPAFAPMGTEYVLAENTYRLGLYHITSGPWCEHVLKERFHCDADHFLFPIDTTIYYPRPRVKADKNILFFAKPEMPRRCFELGLMALEHFHDMQPNVEIILFGSRSLENKPLPFPATIRSLLPTINDLAELYTNADLGIVFSTTNPSLVPYEMMACGLPVVDLGRPGNEINYGGRYDLALLADPDPSAMARQIADLLGNPTERSSRSRNALDFIKTFPSEEQMARRVEGLILARLAGRNSAGRAAATATTL